MKFKRISILLLLILTLGTLFSSMVSAEENKKGNLVALGDSITFGYLLEANQTKASPNAFPSLIEKDDFNVTNLGVPGWTSTELLNAVQPNAASTIALKSANVVTVDIGSNDLLNALKTALANNIPPNTLTIDQFMPVIVQMGNNLTDIIKNIKQTNPNATIILYNLYNPYGESSDPLLGSLHSLGDQLIPYINSQVISPIALQSGSLLADAYKAFNGKQSDYILSTDPNHIHPNLTGHQVLAELGEKALESLNQPGNDDHSGDDQSDNNNPNPGDNNTGNTGDNNSGQNNSGQTPTQTQTPAQTTTTTTPVTTSAPVVTSTTNYSLPNTATPSYNYVGAGFILIIAGLSVYIIQRKRQSSRSV